MNNSDETAPLVVMATPLLGTRIGDPFKRTSKLSVTPDAETPQIPEISHRRTLPAASEFSGIVSDMPDGTPVGDPKSEVAAVVLLTDSH